MTVVGEDLQSAIPVDLSENGGLFFSRIREKVGPNVGVGLVLRHNPGADEQAVRLQLGWMGLRKPSVHIPQSTDWKYGLREMYARIVEEDPGAEMLWVPESVAALTEMFDSLLPIAQIMTGKDAPRVSLWVRYWAGWEVCRYPNRYTATAMVDDVTEAYQYRSSKNLESTLMGCSPRIAGCVVSEIQHFYEQRTALLTKVA